MRIAHISHLAYIVYVTHLTNAVYIAYVMHIERIGNANALVRRQLGSVPRPALLRALSCRPARRGSPPERLAARRSAGGAREGPAQKAVCFSYPHGVVWPSATGVVQSAGSTCCTLVGCVASLSRGTRDVGSNPAPGSAPSRIGIHQLAWLACWFASGSNVSWNVAGADAQPAMRPLQALLFEVFEARQQLESSEGTTGEAHLALPVSIHVVLLDFYVILANGSLALSEETAPTTAGGEPWRSASGSGTTSTKW